MIEQAHIFLGDIGSTFQNHVESEGFSVVQDFCGHGLGKEFHKEPNVLLYGKKGTGVSSSGKYEKEAFTCIEAVVENNEGLRQEFAESVDLRDALSSATHSHYSQAVEDEEMKLLQQEDKLINKKEVLCVSIEKPI